MLKQTEPHENTVKFYAGNNNENKVVFVIGPPCSGKSTFIKSNFPDRKHINIFDYQGKMVTVQTLMEAYDKCKEDIVKSIKAGEKVVIEHTLLKAVRRKPYIDAIKEVSKQEIDVYFLIPTKEKHLENFKKRGISLLENEIDDYCQFIELPTVDEGFANVVICH